MDTWQSRWGLRLWKEYLAASLPSSLPRSVEKSIVFVANVLITFARRFFQSLTVNHRDISFAVTNQALLLKRLQNFGHARTAAAKHVGQEFMRKRQVITFNPIVSHQKPATAARADGM